MSSASRSRQRRALRAAAACPDCRSTVRILRVPLDGSPWAQVAHDDTCPTYRAAGAKPFRELRLVAGVNR